MIIPLVGIVPDLAIKCSADLAEYARRIFKDRITLQEDVYLVCLNRNQEPMFYELLNRGDYEETIIDTRMMVYYAFSNKSNLIGLIHNHTYGPVNPSDADIERTKTIVLICKEMHIRLMDHIILNESEYYSFRDNGLIT